MCKIINDEDNVIEVKNRLLIKLEDDLGLSPKITIEFLNLLELIIKGNSKVTGVAIEAIPKYQFSEQKPVQQLQNDPWLMLLIISGIVLPIIYLFNFFWGMSNFVPWLHAHTGGELSPGAGVGSFLWLYGLPFLFAIIALKTSLKYRKKNVIRLTIFILVFYLFWLLTSVFFQGGGNVIFYFLEFGPWGYVYSNGIALEPILKIV